MTDRLERLINLVIALRETRQPMTAGEIRRRVAGYGQDEPEAFRRMFERDKADLRALGVPVETAPLDPWEDRVGYRILPQDYDLPPVQLAPEELAALAVALQATGLADEGASALRKLEVDAGEPRADVRPPTRLEVDLDAPHRDTLMQAQLTRTVVRFPYRPMGRPEDVRTVDPHALVHRGGRWYLVGRDHDRDERRAFRLDRIAGRVRTVGSAGAFDEPPHAGVEDVVPAPPADGPPTAEVVAAPAVAWQVARRALGGGQEAPAPAGAGGEPWTRFTVVVGDPGAFVSWMLEFGPEAVVAAPEALRARLLASLDATLRASEEGA
jgi:predicted DNA-binding transcriptional regulator YafY